MNSPVVQLVADNSHSAILGLTDWLAALNIYPLHFENDLPTHDLFPEESNHPLFRIKITVTPTKLAQLREITSPRKKLPSTLNIFYSYVYFL